MAYLRGRFETPEAWKKRIERSGEKALVDATDAKNPPSYFSTFDFKDPTVDELLPLLIILAQRRPEVKEFYKNLFKFLVDFHRGGSSTWVGQWMNNKLLCKIMERFGLLEIGGSASYDAGLSWAFGVVSATEFLSDIQVGDIVENIFTEKKEKE